MSRFLIWSVLNALAAAFAFSNRSDILLARGSDALMTAFRVSLPVAFAGLAVFALASAAALYRGRPGSGRAWIRGAAWFIGSAFLLAAGHGVTVGTKYGRVELREFLGPVPIRLFAASGSEELLSSRCDGLFLFLAPTATPEGKIFLGVGPWRLPETLCRHPLLQPAAREP
jgi:hypothetical protein